MNPWHRARLQPQVMRHLGFAAVFATSVLLGCQAESNRLDPVPKDLEGRVSTARAAIGQLKQSLAGRLQAAVQSGGPAAGIEVCATQATQLTADVATSHGVEIGRSSHKLRNPKNEARPWVRAYLREVQDKPARDVKPAVYDLGTTLGVVEPLVAQGLCLTCHGDAHSLPPDVQSKIRERYPNDRATGFAEGDVRGVVWVELTKK